MTEIFDFEEFKRLREAIESINPGVDTSKFRVTGTCRHCDKHDEDTVDNWHRHIARCIAEHKND